MLSARTQGSHRSLMRTCLVPDSEWRLVIEGQLLSDFSGILALYRIQARIPTLLQNTVHKECVFNDSER